jgi:methyltransferase (TIGR00027 family)
MTQSAAIASAETLATLRAVVANETRLAVRCEDRFAKTFVRAKNRIMTSILPQALLKKLFDAAAPGSYCFTIARTRHFDEALLAACRSGVEQIVLLGAGYDSRAFRFSDALAGVAVFEVDHPGTQARKQRILQASLGKLPANIHYAPVDFTRDSLEAALARNGFERNRRALFLWEGVSYYLPERAVQGVLDFVAGCAPGSSIMFDYAIRSFVDGDTSTYGGKQVAAWLEKIGEPFLFGLDPAETSAFLAARKLRVLSDLGPEDLEKRYLGMKDGAPLGRTLGHVRIVHADNLTLI